MRGITSIHNKVRCYAQQFANLLLWSSALAIASLQPAQAADTVRPAAGASCTISAVNRNAPVGVDDNYVIYNIPGTTGPFRARATCSDGTVGQTAVAFPDLLATEVYPGKIVWGKIDPTPVALGLSAPQKRISTGQKVQLQATAIGADASSRDVTPRLQGTSYSVSNALLASVTEDGLVEVLPLFASGSSARVVASATNEGGVAASYMFVLGPRGSLRGKVTRFDGVTPVVNAQVSVIRHQPNEQVGTVQTDASGNFTMTDVNAGTFSLSVIDPVSGDRGQVVAKIADEGDVAQADIKLNGQGQVNVIVLDAGNKPVANAIVSMTALGQIRDTRTLTTDANGRVTFEAVAAGDVTVSTRDPATKLVGSTLGILSAGGNLPFTLRLQPVGTIEGIVLGADGSTPQEGVQVRILSRERGILTQAVTGADGKYSFTSLPLTDGPYTLDAFVDNRLRARVPNVVISQPNQTVQQNLHYSAVATVQGVITDADNRPFDSVSLTLQSLEGLRLSFSGSAGPDGRYMIQGVPVGSFTITAVTPDGRGANTNGAVVADGVDVMLNMQLASTGIVGTVFERDGATPVGAGVAVFLQRNPNNAQLQLTLSAQSPAVTASALTNAQGQYSFAVAHPDIYVVQAQGGDNRGRTQAIITNIIPGQPMTANLAYLGKGSVAGVVRNSAGQVQPGLEVQVKSVGAFTNTWKIVTDANGRYSLANVFVGDIIVSAQQEQTRLAGVNTGRMLAEGNQLSLDINLAATGTVRGAVSKRDNSQPSAPLVVDLFAGSSLLESKTLLAGNAYEFNFVPVGDVKIVATEQNTGDKGFVLSRLSAANETKVADVRLIGQGAVRVKVQDAASVAVVGAKITVRSQSAFNNEVTVYSDAKGEALVQPVFNGDFTVNASKPAQIGQISGSSQGTIVNGSTEQVSLTLQARPTGKIVGTLFGPDGITPRPAMVMRLQPPQSFVVYRTTTDAEGKFSFDNIEGGTSFNLTAHKFDNGGNNDRDRIRAISTGLQIERQDHVVSKDLQMLGSGEVSGVLTLANGNPVPGIKVVFNNPDPVYGIDPRKGNGNYEAISDGTGRYVFADMAAGNFTLRAASADQVLRAEADGRIRFDQDKVTKDLVLVDSAVSMPVTLHDANAMPFDFTGDGSVANGKNGTFTGSGPDARGMRLDILVGGVPVPFSNGDGSIGRLTQSRQQLEVDELHVSGLNVTRRVFVPKNAYFARYLEVLENRSERPITVDVRVTSHHSQSDSNPRIVDTSDGDDVLSILDNVNRDRWLVVDDQRDADPFKNGSIPATGHIFDGVNAARQASSAGYELVGQTGRLRLQWNSITVQPGQTVSLMHFALNQLDRYRAREAALRLAQIPPEAMQGMTAEDRAAVLNFVLPQDGVSSLPALPALDVAQISGKVLSGDGVTPVANATVHFKSKHLLFGRDITLNSDAEGKFTLKAQIDGTSSSRAIAQYAFDLDARHPVTGVTSSVAVNDFPAENPSLVQDLIFNGTANIRGTVKRPSGSAVAGADVYLRNEADYNIYTTRTRADGTYLMTGVPPKDYRVAAVQAHPQAEGQACCGIEGFSPVAAIGGATTVVDVELEKIGSITGIVRAANGQPVVGAKLELTDSKTRLARKTISDTAGRYRFLDVKLGNTRLSAYDEVSRAGAEATVEVTVDNESVMDMTLRGFGTLQVQVNYARGVPASNARVLYTGLRSGRGDTDTVGKASFSVPVSTYQLQARHPDNAEELSLAANGTAELINNGDTANVVLTLKAAGTIKGTIVRPDGSSLAGGFPYTVRLLDGGSGGQSGGNSDAVGNYRISGLKLGTYLVTAYDPQKNRFADAEVVVAADGDEVVSNLILAENRIALPANLLDANRFTFDVQKNGSISTGTGAFAGALKLSVNGEVFNGDTSALLEAGKRQFAISTPQTIAGLTVTRKVYVPKGAYFARYLEIFENPSNAPITVNARLQTSYPSAQLITSSSQGATLSAQDHWFVLDDALDGDWMITPQQPTTAHVQGQVGSRVLADIVQMTDDAAQRKNLEQAWNNLTVPAGGKVALMHFVVQQIDRASAQAAAKRLQALPPEVVRDLSATERAAIVNFTVPEASTVPALPSLTGSISGRVFEGDGVTTVNNTRVTVQSSHPLFPRVWGMKRDSSWFCNMQGTPLPSLVAQTIPNQDPSRVVNGVYSVQGALTDTDSIAIPAEGEIRVVAQEARFCFGQSAGHPVTHIPSRSYTLANAQAQDVLYDSGILTGTVSGPADLGITSGRVWRATDNPDYPDYFYVPVAADGTYVFPGLLPGTYDMLTDVPQPQGSKLRGERMASKVDLGRTTVTDLQLQATGSIAGAILTANGEASVGARVVLTSPAANQQYEACLSCVDAYAPNKGKREVRREASTDSLGRYQLSAVPVGQYTLEVTDPIAGAKKAVSLAVPENQRVVQNLTLLALGSVKLTVNKARGAAVPDANVYLLADAEGVERLVGRTNGAGQLTVANVPFGNYRLRVTDPRFPFDGNYDRTTTGQILSNGDVQQNSVTLLAVATLLVKVVDGDNGNTPVANANVSVNNLSLGNTDANGQVPSSALREGEYRLSAYATFEGTDLTLNQQTTVRPEDDGGQREVMMAMKRVYGSLDVLVVDKDNNNAPLVGARVSLTTSEGNRGMVGETDANGRLLISRVAQGPLQVKAIARHNGVLKEVTVAGEITPANIGQRQAIIVRFEQGTITRSTLRFDGERHVYTVPMQAGDVLAVSVKGAPVDQLPSAYLVHNHVYDAASTRLASGYGYGESGGFQQYNEFNDLRNIRRNVAGNVTLTAKSYYSGQNYTGGYELAVTVNGSPVALQSYADGGVVHGKLTLADGQTPIVGSKVRLRNTSTLALHVETETDAQGMYRFEGVPVGNFSLRALSNEIEVASASAYLAQKGQVVELNMVRPAVTTIKVKALRGDGTPFSGAYVSWDNKQGGRGGLIADANGEGTVRYVGQAPVEVSAAHPNYQFVKTSETVNVADNQTIAIELRILAASLSGRVLRADGSPASGILVQLNSPLQSRYDMLHRVNADENGAFTMPQVPAGQELVVSANAWNSPVPSAMQRITLQDTQEKNDLVLQMPGLASISGQIKLSTGRVLPGQFVDVYWEDWIKGSGYKYAYADENGNFLVNDVPSNLSLTLRGQLSNWIGDNTNNNIVHEIKLSLNNGEQKVQDVVFPVGAVVHAMLRTPDGESPEFGYCNFTFRAGNLQGTTSSSCNSEKTYYGLPAGPVTVEIGLEGIAPYGSKTINAVADQEMPLVVPLSKFIGTVRYADGSIVPFPNVYVTDSAGQSLNSNGTTEEGGYSIIGAVPGLLNITAQDRDGLSVTREVSLNDTETIGRFDLTLPADGIVAGTVNEYDGPPVADVEVFLNSSETGGQRSTRTDAEGRYSFARVALGAVKVVAYDGLAGSLGEAYGSLQDAGQTKVVNVIMSANGSLSGKLLGVDGVSVVPNAPVKLVLQQSGAPYSYVQKSVNTDDAGLFSFTNVPPGKVKVYVEQFDDARSSATAMATIVSNEDTALELRLGTAFLLPQSLASDENYTYEFGDNLNIIAREGEWSTRYGGYYNLDINGQSFSQSGPVQYLQGKRELVAGPTSYGAVEVTRRFFVPQVGGFMRMLESLHNTSDQPQTVSVRLHGSAQMGEGPLRFKKIAAGSGYLVYTVPDYGTEGSDAFITVFNSANGGLPPASSVFNNIDASFSYAWKVIVPARSTVNLLHYTSLATADLASSALARAQALANGTSANMFDGMSAADKAAVKNFTLP